MPYSRYWKLLFEDNSVIQTGHAGLLSDCGNKKTHMPSSVLLTDNLKLEWRLC